MCRWEVEEERVPMLSREEEEEERGEGGVEETRILMSESESEEEEVVLVRGEVIAPSLRVTSVQS